MVSTIRFTTCSLAYRTGKSAALKLDDPFAIVARASWVWLQTLCKSGSRSKQTCAKPQAPAECVCKPYGVGSLDNYFRQALRRDILQDHPNSNMRGLSRGGRIMPFSFRGTGVETIARQRLRLGLAATRGWPGSSQQRRVGGSYFLSTPGRSQNGTACGMRHHFDALRRAAFVQSSELSA